MKDVTSTNLDDLFDLTAPETGNAAAEGPRNGVEIPAAQKSAYLKDSGIASPNQTWDALNSARRWVA